MHYLRIGEYLAASHVTGPRHNLLQMRLGQGPQRMPICERLPSTGNCKHGILDEAELIQSVLEGVAEANRKFNTNHCVTHIRYIENDTGPAVVFALLASKIVEHFCSGGALTEQAASPQVQNAL